MKLSELQEMWSDDAKIEPLDLTNESLKIPKLHSKYLNYLTSFRLQLRKAESDYLRLRKNKYKYYKGEMSREELEELNWKQYLGPKMLKQELADIIESDDDIIALIDKIEYIKTLMYQLENILKSLNSRSFDIKNAITYLQYTQGSL